MKIISSAVLVALFAATNARFLDANTTSVAPTTAYNVASFSNSLNCGQCIGAGYTYCINKAENTTTNSYVTGTNGQMCYQSGTTNANELQASWSCSSAFADRVYSKYTCQFNTAACGTQQYFYLANVNSTAAFNVTNLAAGQTCFYKVEAGCGAPAFRPNTTDRVEIEYVEFRNADVNQSEVVRGYNNGTAYELTKKQSTPAVGMPRRGQFFFAELGGNLVQNANMTTYNASVNGTVYGRSGRFDESASTPQRKVFGNPTQGNTQLGMKFNQTHADCSLRTQYIAVTATTDGAYVNMALSSVDFYKPVVVTTGAAFLSMTFAAVFGLISLSLF